MEIDKPTFDFTLSVAGYTDKVANITHNHSILSILVATMPNRKALFTKLMAELYRQKIGLDDFVEIISDSSIEYNIGVKRNELLKQAWGKYIVFIDDDDWVSLDYIKLILDAINLGDFDCIGINGIITTNGYNERKWFISKDYANWHTGTDGTYYRTPNHISPVKRELALRAGFPDVSFAEDAEYSRRLHPLLKTEIKIQEPLYHYKFRNDK